ncbi:calcineurin B homologous protein 3 [Salmo salar]|uniref:Calcineurin B homologous protein 3 n=2 Tax=Salmo TaxID=8028 RepID=A0A673YWL7_SALTR|nr:calcineurin B homologous protein 3-like [Salmo salar]XP_029572195.1 calcineurin B homologous protein 3-like [Salmo trutta]|eukprot:XP_014026709.1 PREDICTED: calcineurin B homologous protein 3-like [Salmo salar]
MGASQSARTEHEFQDLADRTGFSLEQIGNLNKRFRQLSKNEETLSRQDLASISALDNNPLRAQIINAFFDKRNLRQNEAGTVQVIGFEEFLMVMSHFRPAPMHITEEEREKLRREKLRFVFNMHDTDSDGTITLEEYRRAVEELLSKAGTIGQETAKAIADAAMLEVASTTRGKMEPDEFYEGITFENFLQILKTFDIETRMHVRFLNMDTATMRCGK